MIDFSTAEGFGSYHLLPDGSTAPLWREFGPLLRAALPELRAHLSPADAATGGAATADLRDLRFSARSLDDWERRWLGGPVTTGSVPRRMTAWRAAAGLPKRGC